MKKKWVPDLERSGAKVYTIWTHPDRNNGVYSNRPTPEPGGGGR